MYSQLRYDDRLQLYAISVNVAVIRSSLGFSLEEAFPQGFL
ncbi:hypothetical protein [Chamaesiphon sp. OTE_75_metabat_556]|nr:hypothetical protein [Chamaesiphon sp. OTE_75_metabat_556]